MVLLKIATKKEHLSLGTGRLNLLQSLNLAQNNKWPAGKPAANSFCSFFKFYFLISCLFLERVGIGCSVRLSSIGQV